MRRLFLTALLLAAGTQFLFATTYFKNWVNGNVADTMTQGDFYAWEYDVSVAGGSAHLQLYIDVNHNQTVDSSDVLLIEFDQTDGVTDEDGPPPDSSSTPDGIIYTQLGPFGFAPADYIFKVQDQNDQSTALGFLHINPLSPVNVWISGQLHIENIQPPDPHLANFMIEANVEDADGPGWTGLTDDNGNFVINLPDSAVGKHYKISFSFENQLIGYIPENDSYHDVLIQSGANSGYDFSLLLPKTWVYGTVRDQDGRLVSISDGGGTLINLQSGLEVDYDVYNGEYKVGAPFGPEDSTNVPFHLNFWSDELVPDYLIPNTWNNPYYDFQLSIGDSVEKNILVYSTDAIIYVIARQEGQPLSGDFRVNANNDQYGQTYTYCNGDSITELHVHGSEVYYVGLMNTDEGNLNLPPGYFLQPGNWQPAVAGDTVRFFIKKAPNLFTGHVRFAPGDPPSDLQNCIVEAFTFDWSKYIQAPIDPDSLYFAFGVPNDTFSVRLTCWNGDYLSKPVEYANIVAHGDTIENLDFTLNYAHADLIVKLNGAPVDPNQPYGMHIFTDGIYPDIYQTDAELQPDTTFHFRVCDGRWNIYPPVFSQSGNDYLPDPPSQTVEVSNDSSQYYVEFNYITVGIEKENPVPKSFYVKQNYPNPFNPSTTLEFGLPAKEQVTVDIYNLAGQKIKTLFSGTMGAGVHRLKWQANGFASGMYFYKIQTPEKTVVKRMLLIK